MKQLFIGSLVGGVIIFIYLAVSWMVSPIHVQTFRYTPAQDSILAALTHIGESGAYLLPAADNRNVTGYSADYQSKEAAVAEERVGKPGAVVLYRNAVPGMSAFAFIGGFLADFIAVFIVSLILIAARDRITSFFARWWLVMLVPVVMLCMDHAPQLLWMGYPWHYVSGFITDAFFEWALVGVWLGWWYRKN
jgi:hypothetical protein